ncbi:hypothetical protein GCM10007981_07100 [Thermocladium modestius]|uniref:Uncharacterized protein n=2 Tax=Thermocladium modestius TaxID=62609 RepID=A0A830GTD2_9CREN|nr:hypothetical protein GCM10007981_07100 [Thermocladium modestius]
MDMDEEVPYKRLIELVNADPAYSMVEDGIRVEIIFNPPSRGEAMGVGEDEEERPVLRIVGERRGDVVVLREAWVEDAMGERRRMDLSELELWIQSLTNR